MFVVASLGSTSLTRRHYYVTGYLIKHYPCHLGDPFRNMYSGLSPARAGVSELGRIPKNPLDDWREDHPDEGIYEHITRTWLPSKRLIHFAEMREWVVQAFTNSRFAGNVRVRYER